MTARSLKSILLAFCHLFLFTLSHSPVKEGVTKIVELAERFVGVHDKSIAWDHPLNIAVHDSSETVSCRFRPSSTSWVVLFKKIPEKYTTII